MDSSVKCRSTCLCVVWRRFDFGVTREHTNRSPHLHSHTPPSSITSCVLLPQYMFEWQMKKPMKKSINIERDRCFKNIGMFNIFCTLYILITTLGVSLYSSTIAELLITLASSFCSRVQTVVDAWGHTWYTHIDCLACLIACHLSEARYIHSCTEPCCLDSHLSMKCRTFFLNSHLT